MITVPWRYGIAVRFWERDELDVPALDEHREIWAEESRCVPFRLVAEGEERGGALDGTPFEGCLWAAEPGVAVWPYDVARPALEGLSTRALRTSAIVLTTPTTARCDACLTVVRGLALTRHPWLGGVHQRQKLAFECPSCHADLRRSELPPLRRRPAPRPLGWPGHPSNRGL